MALRALMSKIHPRQPLTSRESDHILSAITTSFRKQLVSEPRADNLLSELHPVFDDSSNRKSKSSSAPSPSEIEQLNSQVSSSALVDRHLNAVLASPLFSLRPRVASGASGQNARSMKDRVAEDQRITDPLTWFEEHVALGTATPEMARRCLEILSKTQWRRSRQENIIMMKESRAGSRVLNWLWSSGLDKLQAMTGDPILSRLLICHLVAEGRSHVVWKLLQVHDRHPSVPELRKRGSLLSCLVRAESLFGSGADAAVQHFLRAVHHIQGMVHIESNIDASFSKEPRDKKIKPGLESAHAFLAGSGILLFRAFRTTPFYVSTDLFRQFVWTLPLWDLNPVSNRARLLLYNHQNPDPLAALTFFCKAASHGVHLVSTYALPFGLDTAQALLKRKRYAEAAWLMGFLQQSFPDKLDLHTDQQQAGCLRKFLDRPDRFYREAAGVVAFFRKQSEGDLLDPGSLWAAREHSRLPSEAADYLRWLTVKFLVRHKSAKSNTLSYHNG